MMKPVMHNVLFIKSMQYNVELYRLWLYNSLILYIISVPLNFVCLMYDISHAHMIYDFPFCVLLLYLQTLNPSNIFLLHMQCDSVGSTGS